MLSSSDRDGRSGGFKCCACSNQLLLKYTGWTLEDLKASDFPAMILHPGDFERLRDERQKALARGDPFELELRARRNDGQYRWFLVRYNPLRDELDNVLRWYASATDIDDRKRAEDRLQLLLDVTNQVVSICNSATSCGAISSSVRRVMQCDLVSVCFPDTEMKRLQLVSEIEIRTTLTVAGDANSLPYEKILYSLFNKMIRKYWRLW